MPHQVNLAGQYFLAKLEYANMLAEQAEMCGEPVENVVIYERRANANNFSVEKWQPKIGQNAELKYGYPKKEDTIGKRASVHHIEGKIVSVEAQTIVEGGEQFAAEEAYKLRSGASEQQVGMESRRAIAALGSKAGQDVEKKITRIGIELSVADVRAILGGVRERYQQQGRGKTL